MANIKLPAFVLSFGLLAGCVENCAETDVVSVELAGQRYVLTTDAPASFIGVNEGDGYGVKVNRSSADGRVHYCNVDGGKVISVDTIAFSRDRIGSWPQGYELLNDFSQFAIERGPDQTLPLPHEAGRETSIPGWFVHGDGKSYQLTAQGLVGWSNPILANCNRAEEENYFQGRCRVTTQWGAARMVADFDLKHTPPESWPNYLRAIEGFFLIFRE